MADKLTHIEILKALTLVARCDISRTGCSMRKEDVVTLLDYIESLLEVGVWYEEAMAASNTHGYAFMSAADVINAMAKRIKELETKDGH